MEYFYYSIITVASFFIITSFTFAEEKHPDFKVSVNDTIKIELPYTAGTGYMWYLEKHKKAIVDSVSIEYIYNTNLIGGAGTAVWYFVARKEGKETISFTYKRPWETTKSDQSKSYTIKVK